MECSWLILNPWYLIYGMRTVQEHILLKYMICMYKFAFFGLHCAGGKVNDVNVF